MKKKLSILIIVLSVFLFVIHPVLFNNGYCIVYPHLGTKFLTKEFKKSKFKKIKKGYVKDDVEKSLGKTNDIRIRKNCYVCSKNVEIPKNVEYCAYYSEQNSWLWGSLAFEVFVIYYDRNFVVIDKQQGWYID